MRSLILSVLVCIVALLPVAPVAAQDETPTMDPAAEAAFAPMLDEFRILFESFRGTSGYSADDRAYIESLLERVVAHMGTHPNHVRAVAMAYQLTTWLKDDETSEVYLDQLLELMPNNIDLALPRSRTLRRSNQYDRALTLLDRFSATLADSPEASLVYANCLYANDRFEDALATLEAVDIESLGATTFIRSQIETRIRDITSQIERFSAERALRDAEAAADDLPRAQITMSNGGKILIELFENEAPNTVANFVSLTTSGFYDGTTFHSVINNLRCEGGDPNSKEGATGTLGEGGPGYTIADEHDAENARNHFAGSVAMEKQANAGSSVGSRFYITHEPMPNNNGRRTVFGRVIEGLDVVRAIEKDDRIATIVMVRQRDHAYEPIKVGAGTAPPVIENPPPGGSLDDQ